MTRHGRIVEIPASFDDSPHEKWVGERPPVRINWGRGRLAPFASQASFVAQFCALNDLNPKEFKSFFSRYLGRTKDPWWRLDDEDVLPLARLLDEPRGMVRTLNANLQLPSCYAAFRADFQDARLKYYLSYCPSCLRAGYHSAFHETPWLYLCPIHREPLARSDFFGSYEQHIATVTRLLRAACPTWPNTQPSGALPDRGRRKEIKELLEWLRVVRQKAAVLRAQNVGSLDQTPYHFRDLGILLGRLEALEPIPQSLLEVFLVPPCPQTQAVESLARETVVLIAKVARTVPLDDLLSYYVMTAARLGQTTRFRSLAMEGIEKLKNKHDICECEWKWDRYAQWNRAHAGEIHNSYYLCPYTYAMEELTAAWVDFCYRGLPTEVRHKILHAYVLESRDLVSRGLAAYVDSPDTTVSDTIPFHMYRIPSLTLGNDLDQALNAILSKQVVAHCEELLSWTASMTPGTQPVRERSPGAVNIFVDGCSASISSWRRAPGHITVPPEARWREGMLLDTGRINIS